MENHIRYDWVFFDQGGTLDAAGKADPNWTKPAHRTGRALLKWFCAIGRPLDLSDEEMEQITVEAHEHTAGAPGQISIEQNREFYARWLSWIYTRVGIGAPHALAELEAAHTFMIWQVGRESASPTADVTRRTLERLRDHGLHLGAISNNAGYVQDILLYDSILALFEVVIDSARVGIVKPDRRIFDLAVEQVGAHGQRLLYVGDNYDADVVGATAAGWDVVWISRDTRELPDDGVYQIHCLSELESICGVQEAGRP